MNEQDKKEVEFKEHNLLELLIVTLAVTYCIVFAFAMIIGIGLMVSMLFDAPLYIGCVVSIVLVLQSALCFFIMATYDIEEDL
jgi:Mn2+/Fe2+ NRAMP family transporter